MTRPNRADGLETRRAILRTAADLASVDGLEGITIGRLATELGMSKSGLFAHFGSKEDLQLATIEHARQRYVDEVLSPALSEPAGIVRLQALCESFLSYVARDVFPGGCFFAATMAEYDGKPDGPVRDLVADCQEQWMGTLERTAARAREEGQLRPGCDPRQLAFELEAALLAANWYVHLHHDASFLDRARQAVHTRLTAEATARGRTALGSVRQRRG
ncbi:MAG TPA: TetR/AcrR family transcriptional regulator [Acidimicrobiales bacterium]|nr:TetR/AcrR family transcriptional regulator [Acidimicrobiales bacterium]